MSCKTVSPLLFCLDKSLNKTEHRDLRMYSSSSSSSYSLLLLIKLSFELVMFLFVDRLMRKFSIDVFFLFLDALIIPSNSSSYPLIFNSESCHISTYFDLFEINELWPYFIPINCM